MLEALGHLAAGQGQVELAAHLLGAAEALLQQNNAFLNPVLQPLHDSLASKLRDQLGERAFTTAWAAGAAMELDEVIALVLNDRGLIVAKARPEQTQ
jgi:hypothetical protein